MSAALGIAPAGALGFAAADLAPALAPRVLLVRLGRERFALPLGEVLEVMEAPALQPVALAPSGVVGQCLHRDRLVPVVDAATLLAAAKSVIAAILYPLRLCRLRCRLYQQFIQHQPRAVDAQQRQVVRAVQAGHDGAAHRHRIAAGGGGRQHRQRAVAAFGRQRVGQHRRHLQFRRSGQHRARIRRVAKQQRQSRHRRVLQKRHG